MLDPINFGMQISKAEFFASDAHRSRLAVTFTLYRPDAKLSECINGVSVWAFAAFSGNAKVLEYLLRIGCPYVDGGLKYPHVIAALFRSDRNYGSVYQTISFLVEKCDFDVNEAIPRENIFGHPTLLGFDASMLSSKPFLTALDVTKILATQDPAAKDIIDLIESYMSAMDGKRDAS